MLDAKTLRKLLRYDSADGSFVWLISGKRQRAGDKAGWLEPSGYVRIAVCGRSYLAHRLAWLYQTGKWPKDSIDHKNMVRSDNRFENLRAASRTENKINQRVRSDSVLRVKGVQLHQCGKYRARLVIAGRRMHLGFFDTIEDAAKAYADAATKNYGEYARAA